jgi:Lanthionine synthetase C-like protein
VNAFAHFTCQTPEQRPLLFEPGRHEPLLDSKWDTDQAHEAIRAIVADLESTLGSGIAWPAHPLDDPDDPNAEHKTLYLGAAGTLWAMWYLERAGAVKLRVKPSDLIGPIYQSYLAKPDTGEVVPSYYLGEAGILLVLWRLTQSSTAADRLRVVIEANILNPTNEALWAAPGTMVGAWHMLQWTGERRWHDLFLENVEQLWRTWLPSGNAPCHLWTQDLYGRIVQLIGAGHGFAGNVYPLLRGATLLTDEQRELLYDRCVETLRATAEFEDDGVNWPPSVGPSRPGPAKVLMQWCHGAPGIVTGLADFPRGRSAEMDGMLIKAGTAVWKAGPLEKGHGLCHGTAGNGYALLKVYRRTGDPIWLERAQSFAMHAIAQWERMRQQYGRGRYTLWTGDPGLAVYIWHCMTGADGMPGLDILD